jgi:PAS domain S-box-containing protein
MFEILTTNSNAAEKMFGYTTAEILEGNMNIKSMMPLKYSENHDTYLLNYFSTGVKKVIGTGRLVQGLKKNGTEFPIHLSISEVVEDGFHLFTAIVRDMTEV